MIRRLVLIALSLAVLGGCATYDRGYRYAAPSQAGYGDYYYDPAPAPSYLAPAYVQYPAYYSLYWGFDHHYYSSWRRPGFHYGVTWFPNDWFAFSVVNRHPIGFRRGYGYWGHPYSPYRFSYFDHHYYARHHHRPSRHRDHYRPRYGHPSNEGHIRREMNRRFADHQQVDPRERNDRRVRNDPRDRLVDQGPGRLGNRDMTMRERDGATGPRRGGPGATALPPGAQGGHMRNATGWRSAGAAGTPTPATVRPWQDGARAEAARDAARRASTQPGTRRIEQAGTPRDMGIGRAAAMRERQGGARPVDPAPRRIERMGQAPAPVNRTPARQAAPAPAARITQPAREAARPARVPARQQMQQPQVQRPQAPRTAAPAVRQAPPARNAAPQRAPAATRSAAPRPPASAPRSAPVRQPAAAPARAVAPRAPAASRRAARPPAERER